ncbi:MAG: nucleotidyltransferase family protein [Pseudomonadota bacterium]
MKAMVLAAGFGKRLRPITLSTPKPLVKVAGRTLLDRTLDQLARGGITHAVVNVHYLGEQIIEHAQISDHAVAMRVSDERAEVLETAGGIVKALSMLGDEPFISLNADTFWVEQGEHAPAVQLMRGRFDHAAMDILLLLCHPDVAIGHSGGIDFTMAPDGRLSRANGATDGYVYAGAAILHPRLFQGAKAEPHSLNRYFDRAIATGRLHGIVLENAFWYTVSTPDSLVAVEEHLRVHGDTST